MSEMIYVVVDVASFWAIESSDLSTWKILNIIMGF